MRLAIPAAVAWAVTAAALGVGGAAPVVVAWAVAGLLLAASVRWPRMAVAALAGGAAALCVTSVALQAPQRQPAELVAATGRVVTVTGTVTAHDPLAVSLDPGTVPVLAFGSGAGADGTAAIGSRVELRGTLEATAPWDGAAFLVFLERPPRLVAEAPSGLGLAEDLRATFRAATSTLPGDGGALLTGLAIGDTTAVGDGLDAAMKTSSLSHLTAVSGANCAIVVGLVFGAAALLRLSRGMRVTLALVALLGFVVLVTPEPSVLRAAVMAGIVLLALLGGRPVRGVPVLALAVIVVLVADPWLARDFGFALSVLATSGLLLVAGPLSRVFERWLPRWLAIVIAVPVAAQLACQPVLILLDASLPTYGVVANLLAAPAAPIATIVGLAACLVLPVVPPLGMLLCQIAWLPSAWIAAVATTFARAPGARLPWPEGVAGVLLAAGFAALLLLAILGRRRAPRLALALVVIGYLGVLAGAALGTAWARPANWQLAVCDVGQGDAVVIRSRGSIALIDTGPEPDRLDACLDTLRIDRIDLLVLTHYDLDHVGGSAAVLGRADRVLVGPSGEPADDALHESFGAAGARVDQVARGESGMLGDLRWTVLWPPTRLAGIDPGNPASVTMEFRGVGDCADGCLSSILLGDLGEDSQNRLLTSGLVRAVDVVKVSHHGSADQSLALYARLSATVGVIGVGADNGYGHPTPELLGILADVATVPERTDRQGLILLSPGTGLGTVRVWSER